MHFVLPADGIEHTLRLFIHTPVIEYTQTEAAVIASTNTRTKDQGARTSAVDGQSKRKDTLTGRQVNVTTFLQAPDVLFLFY